MKVYFLSLLLLFFVFPASLYAQNSTNSAVAKTRVDYALPYPGILPTSPFYSLKMFRDRVVGYLISDPLKKAEFSLLQADKRLQAGVYLLHKDKTKSTLAMLTISKGENYFAEAFDIVADARRQKLDTYDVSTKLYAASQKHYEVLLGIESAVPAKDREAYKKELIRVRGYIIQAKSLMLR